MLQSLHAAELEWIVQLQRWPIPEFVMKALSNLGPSPVLLGLVGLVCLCWDTKLGARLLMLYLAASVCSFVAKLAFHTPRPFWMDERVLALEPTATSFGLPSGHAVVATCVWFLFATTLGRRWRWFLATGVVFCVSVSRVWLGAHFFSDVVAGFLFGLGILKLFLAGEARVRARLASASLEQQIAFAVFITVIALALGMAARAGFGESVDAHLWPRYAGKARRALSLGGYSGAVLGLGIGLAMALRWAPMRAAGSLRQCLLRILILTGPAAVYWFRPRGLFKELPEALAFWLLFAACALAAWAFAFAVPWLFIRLRLAERAPSLNP